MKKLSFMLIIVALVISMSACTVRTKVIVKNTKTTAAATTLKNDDTTLSTETSSDESMQNITNDAYVFQYNGTTVAIGDTNPSATISALGEPKSYLEAPSCASEGTDKIYTYDDFIVTVFVSEDGTSETIYDIVLMSDLVGTPEGLEIGMTGDDARTIYGAPDEEDLSLLVYNDGNTALWITLDGDTVVSIEYLLK